MLILMRRRNESIRIGDDVQITVMSLDKKTVRLGVKAPRHIVVDREEIAKRKKLGLPPPKKGAENE